MSSYMPRRWSRISGTSSCVARRMSTSRLISQAPVSWSNLTLRDRSGGNKKKAELRSAGGPRAAVPRWFCPGQWLLMLGVFFGQLHLGGFQFLLHTGDIILIDFGGHGLVPLRQRLLPVRRRQLEASRLLVEIA